MGDVLNDVIKFLQEIGGGISSVLLIVGFIVTTVKPIRARFAAWVTKQAKTNDLISRLDSIDSNIKTVNDEVSHISSNLTAHIAENTVDIKNANRAQMMSVRCQIRDIYVHNLPKKSLSIREQRDIHDLYDAYLALGGNSYIHTMVEEMKDWHIHEGL